MQRPHSDRDSDKSISIKTTVGMLFKDRQKTEGTFSLFEMRHAVKIDTERRDYLANAGKKDFLTITGTQPSIW